MQTIPSFCIAGIELKGCWLKIRIIGEAIKAWNMWRLICNKLSWWVDWKTLLRSLKSCEKLFHLQTIEGGEREAADGLSTWISISRCEQAVPFRRFRNGHVWTSLHWRQDRGNSEALRLLVHLLGHLEICLDLNWLSSHRNQQICIATWIPWPQCEWQWQKLHWSQPSKKIKIQKNYQPGSEYLRLQLAQ